MSRKSLGLSFMLLALVLPVWSQKIPGQGLEVKLSPGKTEAAQIQEAPQPAGRPLSPEAIAQIFKRVPAMDETPGDQSSFALREGSTPPPRTGNTVNEPFPVNATRPRPRVEIGKLEVVQHRPEGEVDVAPHLQVTFNQPMVPVSSTEELAKLPVPVKVTPPAPGRWRWLGVTTAELTPRGEARADRFAMSSEYHVEVPAGIASQNGAKLAAPVRWSFRTPTVIGTLAAHSGDGQPLRPVLVLSFNQNVNGAALLPLLTLHAGKNDVALREATSEEITRDGVAGESWKGIRAARRIALVPRQELKRATDYTLRLAAGAPSAEGPLKTATAQDFSFKTYAPLTLTDQPNKPTPRDEWSFEFDNALDEKSLKPDDVEISPPLANRKVVLSGSSISVNGAFQGRTRYKVTFPAKLRDDYGQTLGKALTVTVDVGTSEPGFSGPNRTFVVLDPSGPRSLACNAINYRSLNVQAYRVTPADWLPVKTWLENGERNPIPGQQVMNANVPVKLAADEPGEVKVDLGPALPRRYGHLLVVVEAREPLVARPGSNPEIWRGWVESTDLGLDAMVDGQNALAWVSRLADGAPVPGAAVSLRNGASGVTGADGLVRIPLTQSSELIAARLGNDEAILPYSESYWDRGGWTPSKPSDEQLWYVADDRHMYRPGETVQIKGWVRREQRTPHGGVTLSDATALSWQLKDSRGNKIGEGTGKISPLGGFNFSLSLPKTVNLGTCRLELNSGTKFAGAGHEYVFEVQEFRRPEFEVSAKASPSSCLVGEHASVTVNANYYAGGGLANADASWTVTTHSTSYSPPHWDGYTFGQWVPWWRFNPWWGARTNYDRTQTYATKTDASGESVLRLDFPSVDPPRPSSVSAGVSVQDVNRQAWSSQASVLVHPASVYVGLKSERTFVEAGQPLEGNLIVADLDGRAEAGRTVELTAYRWDWDYVNGSYQYRHVDETHQTLTSGTGPVPYAIKTGEGGAYQIEATVHDAQGRANESELTQWVAGGKQPPKRDVEQESLTLIPDKKEYAPGDVAEILVQCPFEHARAVVSTRRHGLLATQSLEIVHGSATFKVPLLGDEVPNLHVQVDADGASSRTDETGRAVPGATPRPAFATGELDLAISTADKKLQVDVDPAVKATEPGATTDLTLRLRDSKGAPVQGQAAVMMVDESILALTGYDPADPLATFWRSRPSQVQDAHSRSAIQLALAREVITRQLQSDVSRRSMAMPPAPPMAGAMAPMHSMKKAAMRDEAEEPNSTPGIRLRTDFNPLAYYNPEVTTDAAGLAHLKVHLPDNLTRYRLIALAVAGADRFGKGENSLVARQPLMVRPSAPRFLNFGDRCELPVVVQNQTDAPMTVDLVARATNAKLEASGFEVTVPANDRREVRFPCATEKAGTARFQFAGVSSGRADAAQISLPVWTPATTEAFATYGTIDNGAISQPVKAPGQVVPQFGGLEISTSSTALAELTDAYLYLQTYPYECAEQMSSRLLSNAALRDVLAAFKAPGMPRPEELAASVQRDHDHLKALQNDDGGWDYWTRGRPSVPWVSLHVTQALVKMKEKGFAVDPAMLASGLGYVRTIEQHIPAEYPLACRRELRAYALSILCEAGQSDAVKARALVKEGKLSLESLGWLLPTLKDEAIERRIDNAATQTAATAQFNIDPSDGDYLILNSSRRTDAVLLDALVQVDPQNPLLPKLVRGLLDHRTAGRWESTQENCFVLLALDRYFNRFESVTPDFIARVWLGSRYAGEQDFKGRSADTHQIAIPMGYLIGSQDLVLAKDGPGRLYYRLGMKYAPASLRLASADYGFTVSRRYEGIDDPKDVTQAPDGTWHIRAGARVRVSLQMVAPARRYHVALTDPLPAGLEAVNGELAVSEGETPAPRRGRRFIRRTFWRSTWYDHQNLRDERAEAFASLVWGGVYDYAYVARATTPGKFVVPPTKAEEMYHPETFGRSATDRVEVK